MKHNKSIVFVLLLLHLLFYSMPAHANNRDSLQQKLDKTESLEKIGILHQLVVEHLYTEPSLAQEYAVESLNLSLEEANDSLIAYSYYRIALAYHFMEYWSLAAENYSNALDNNWTKTNKLLIARCSNNTGICYEYIGEYKKAAQHYFKSIEISEELGDELLTARTQLNIGMLYIRMAEYEKAIEILEKSLIVLKEHKDGYNIINAYQNFFIAEGEIGNISKSLSYFNLALNMALKNADSLKIADLYVDYGNLLYSSKDYNDANIHFKKALNYTDTISDNASQFYHIKNSIGKNEMYLGNLGEAKRLMTDSFIKLQELEANMWLTGVQLNLARLYARLGDFELSDQYLQDALDHEDKLFKKEKLKSISEMEIKYETDKKEQKLAIQKLKIESQNRRIFFFGIIAIVFALSLVFVLILIKKIKETNKNLFERNKELSSRWEKLRVCNISDQDNNGNCVIYNSISELMNEEQLYKNPELSVDFISKKINSNTKYVSRAIKESTGMNFNTFVNTHRIEEAKKILLESVHRSWSLDAVAEHCGFNNPTTFYTSFKKYTGLTPARYRNII